MEKANLYLLLVGFCSDKRDRKRKKKSKEEIKKKYKKRHKKKFRRNRNG